MARKDNYILDRWYHSNNIVDPFLSEADDEEQAQAYLKEPRMFIESFLPVTHYLTQEVIMPVKLKRLQVVVYDVLQTMRKLGRPMRVVNLKNRRAGLSYIISTYIYTFARFSRRHRTRVVSHLQESADVIFGYYVGFHDSLPDTMRPPLGERKKRPGSIVIGNDKNPDQAARHKYPGIQSKIFTGTAENTRIGRGDGYNALHATEVAFWTDADSLIPTLKKNVPPTLDSIVVEETTAAGMGGYFYEEFHRARKRMKNNPRDFEVYALFLPGWMDEFCQEDLTKEEEDEIRESLNDYERAMLHKYHGVTLNYLSWRRTEIAQNCGGIKAIFDQENAPSLKEVFVSEGRSVFSPQSIEFLMSRTKPGTLGHLVSPAPPRGRKPSPYFVKYNPNKYADNVEKHREEARQNKLVVYRTPVPGRKYFLGADASMGLRSADKQYGEMVRSKDLDYCCACIFDEYYEEVAFFRTGMMDPPTFAHHCAAIGYFYNEARIMPEAGNQAAGWGLVYELKDLYTNIDVYEHLDHPSSGKVKMSLGWPMNETTKFILIGEAVHVVDHGCGMAQSYIDPWLVHRPKLKLYSKELVKEMSSFAIAKDGSFGARKGHDDTVIAMMMAFISLRTHWKRKLSRLKQQNTTGYQTIKQFNKTVADDEEYLSLPGSFPEVEWNKSRHY